VDAEDNDGFFSGWNCEKGEYDCKTWMYEGVDPSAAAGARESEGGEGKKRQTPLRAEHTDPTLQHPRCVFQVLKRHYARYTPRWSKLLAAFRATA